jgi:hypothetical protein
VHTVAGNYHNSKCSHYNELSAVLPSRRLPGSLCIIFLRILGSEVRQVRRGRTRCASAHNRVLSMTHEYAGEARSTQVPAIIRLHNPFFLFLFLRLSVMKCDFFFALELDWTVSSPRHARKTAPLARTSHGSPCQPSSPAQLTLGH